MPLKKAPREDTMAIGFTRRRFVTTAPIAASAGLIAGPALAADYPTGTVRLVVPFTTGGVNDLVARVIAPPLGKILKQPVIVENKPGAGGIVGYGYAARARPDGYTLLVGSLSMIITESIYKNLPYEIEKSFVPISEMAEFTFLLVVDSKSPIKSVHDLIAYCKTHPEKAIYSSGAPIIWLATELFAQKTGLKLTRVAYKGAGGANLSVVSGEVLFTMTGIPAILGQVKSGAVRVLATTGKQRIASFPDVPTLAESGVPDVSATSWAGLLAPAGTSPAIVAKLNTAMRQVLTLPEVKEHFAKLTFNPAGGSTADLRKLIAQDVTLWKSVAQKAGISLTL